MDINLKNKFLSLEELNNSRIATQEKSVKKKQIYKEIIK